MKTMLEIERKFLVHQHMLDLKECRSVTIQQGYLLKGDFGSTRIRIETNNVSPELAEWITPRSYAYIMVKRRIDEMTNKEISIPISLYDAEKLLQDCYQPVIKKTRFFKNEGDDVWEIDFFHDTRDGLVLAEIELQSATQNVDIPDWVDKEVTGEHQYYNSNM